MCTHSPLPFEKFRGRPRIPELLGREGRSRTALRALLKGGLIPKSYVYPAESDITLVRPVDAGEVLCDERIKRFYLALTESQGVETISTLLPQQEQERVKIAELECPICNGMLQRRTGKYGPFFGCNNYQDVDTQETLDDRLSLIVRIRTTVRSSGEICDWRKSAHGFWGERDSGPHYRRNRPEEAEKRVNKLRRPHI